MDTSNQEKTAEDVLQFLSGFGNNLKLLVAQLERDDPMMANGTLRVLTAQDLGAGLMPVFDLTDPVYLQRLAGPLKTIEADLARAGTFASRAGSPTLGMFVPSKLMVVRSVLGKVQKAGGDASASTIVTLGSPKKWWQFWK